MMLSIANASMREKIENLAAEKGRNILHIGSSEKGGPTIVIMADNSTKATNAAKAAVELLFDNGNNGIGKSALCAAFNAKGSIFDENPAECIEVCLSELMLEPKRETVCMYPMPGMIHMGSSTSTFTNGVPDDKIQKLERAARKAQKQQMRRRK